MVSGPSGTRWLFALVLSAGCRGDAPRTPRVAEPEVTAPRVTKDDEYDDPRWASYLEGVGGCLEARAGPGLDVEFVVLDDPGVNAHVLADGRVGVTRGLLARLPSEDALAAVLAHEVAHVTLDHAGSSKRRVERVEQGLAPLSGHLGTVVGVTAVAVLLAYSRRQEKVADAMALDLLQRCGRSPAGMVQLFDVMDADAHEDAPPGWLSTHPSTLSRRRRAVAASGDGPMPTAQAAYLQRLEGMTYGIDPSRGYVYKDVFVSPKTKMRADLPRHWITSMDTGMGLAVEREQQSIIVVSAFEGSSVDEPTERFFANMGESIVRGDTKSTDFGGMKFRATTFALTRDMVGSIAFAATDESTMMLFVAARFEEWELVSDQATKVLESIRAVENRELLKVKPMRISLVEMTESTSVAAAADAYPSDVTVEDFARLNGVDIEHEFAAGDLVRRVVGFNPELEHRYELEVRPESTRTAGTRR